MFVHVRGKPHYLWPAVDQHGNVLDVLVCEVQSRRSKKADKCFSRKLLQSSGYVPKVIVTDKLASYGAGKREILSVVQHRQSRYLTLAARCRTSPPDGGSAK